MLNSLLGCPWYLVNGLLSHIQVGWIRPVNRWNNPTCWLVTTMDNPSNPFFWVRSIDNFHSSPFLLYLRIRLVPKKCDHCPKWKLDAKLISLFSGRNLHWFIVKKSQTNTKTWIYIQNTCIYFNLTFIMFFLCPCNVVPTWKQNVYLKYQIYFGAE